MAGFASFLSNEEAMNLNLINKDFYNKVVPEMFYNSDLTIKTVD